MDTITALLLGIVIIFILLFVLGFLILSSSGLGLCAGLLGSFDGSGDTLWDDIVNWINGIGGWFDTWWNDIDNWWGDFTGWFT
jgi:hypothetical protein